MAGELQALLFLAYSARFIHSRFVSHLSNIITSQEEPTKAALLPHQYSANWRRTVSGKPVNLRQSMPLMNEYNQFSPCCMICKTLWSKINVACIHLQICSEVRPDTKRKSFVKCGSYSLAQTNDLSWNGSWIEMLVLGWAAPNAASIMETSPWIVHMGPSQHQRCTVTCGAWPRSMPHRAPFGVHCRRNFSHGQFQLFWDHQHWISQSKPITKEHAFEHLVAVLGRIY